MLFTLTLILLIVIVSVLTIYVIQEPGYIVLQWDVWQVELSLALGILALVLTVLLLFVGLEVLAGLFKMPGRLGRSYREYRGQKKLTALVRGLQYLLLSDWSKAEQLLDKSAAHLPQPAVGYLAAAYSAHKQGDFQQRNQYLKKARDVDKKDQGLVSLFACRLLIEQGEYREAIEGLKKLCAKLPKNAQAFAMLANAYEQTGDFEALYLLLPHLKKNKALSTDEQKALTVKIYHHRLRSAHLSAQLQTVWNSAPPAAQKDNDVIAAYVRKLLEFNCHQEADKVIRSALNRQWHSDLAYLYGLVNGVLKDERLYDTASDWLRRHPDDADLLLTAGKLARRLGLTGQAQAHLKKSIDLGGRIDAYEELGQLFEEQNKDTEAFGVYKAGILRPQQGQRLITVENNQAAGYSVSEENSKES